MTAISPVTNDTAAIAASDFAPGAQAKPPTDQFGQDTFLKLLVAQMKYQDPMNPTDSTQLLAQTAQFTEVEKLNDISTEMKSQAAATEVLEAGAMVGKDVTVGTSGGAPAVTTVAHIGGNLSVDDPVGTSTSTTTTLYTTKGTAVPVRIQLTKLPDGSDGTKHWEARAFVSTTQIAGPFNVDFDNHGELTSGDITLTAAQLENAPGTTGEWDPNGLRLDLGTAGDSSRLRVATGGDSLTSFGQNGTDGTSIRGVVTGVQFTANGPLLTINDKQYQLGDVTNVNVS
jgi:flagellar basal-body rod modification protein FlgD